MSTLTMPTLMVAFQQRANTAVARSQKGTVAFVIRDAAANAGDQTYALASTGQIPKTLGTANQEAIRRVFRGKPKKVLLYVMGAEAVISAQSPLAGDPEIRLSGRAGRPDGGGGRRPEKVGGGAAQRQQRHL